MWRWTGTRTWRNETPLIECALATETVKYSSGRSEGMRLWWTVVASLLVSSLVGFVPDTEAQQLASVELRLEPQPIGALITPVVENGTARVAVEVVCRAPTALLPGWSIHHEVRVEPPLATATLDKATHTVAMEPMQCADAQPSTYVVSIDVVFHESAEFNVPVRFILEAKPTLQRNPSFTTNWEDRPGFIGGYEAETDYPARVRTGSLNELGFWVTNKANADLQITAEVSSPASLGKVEFTDHRSVPTTERRIFRVLYTPEAEGDDQFEVVVTATAPGGIPLANKTLVYSVISDPEAEPARVRPQYSGEGPAVGFYLIPLGLALLHLARRERSDRSPLSPRRRGL